MSQKSGPPREASEPVVKNIGRATRKHYAAGERLRIVLDGLRGGDSIAELCRREGIAESRYDSWSKGFTEGEKQLSQPIRRQNCAKIVCYVEVG